MLWRTFASSAIISGSQAWIGQKSSNWKYNYFKCQFQLSWLSSLVPNWFLYWVLVRSYGSWGIKTVILWQEAPPPYCSILYSFCEKWLFFLVQLVEETFDWNEITATFSRKINILLGSTCILSETKCQAVCFCQWFLPKETYFLLFCGDSWCWYLLVSSFSSFYEDFIILSLVLLLFIALDRIQGTKKQCKTST